jgi:predicted HTH domain antitoxin
MKVTFDVPDDISAVLEDRWPDLPRQALETLAVEAYRTGTLTEGQVRRLLQLETRFEVHALLKAHGVPLRYSEADFEDDLTAHREIGILRD